jgi:hypothetical protein
MSLFFQAVSCLKKKNTQLKPQTKTKAQQKHVRCPLNRKHFVLIKELSRFAGICESGAVAF